MVEKKKKPRRLTNKELDLMIGKLFTKHQEDRRLSLNGMGSVYFEVKGAIRSLQDGDEAMRRAIEKYKDQK